MRKVLMACVLIGMVLLSISACAQECTELQNSSNEEMTSYLDGVASHGGDPTCIAFAIKSLGANRYEPAIPVLVRLLTIREARSKIDEYVPSKNRPEYPAMQALMRMGEAALPALLRTLETDDTPPIAKQNAVYVWMVIHRHDAPKGVAALKQAADNATDTKSKQSLLLAISSAVKLCTPKDKELCESAARANYQ